MTINFMQASTNYIYIILAVAYVIYSIIKAGKKVTQNRPTIDQQPQSSPTVQPPTSAPPPQHDFKKMLEDLLGGTPEEEMPAPAPELRSQPSPAAQLPQEKSATHPKPFRKESLEKPVKITTHHAPKSEKATASHAKPLPAHVFHTTEKATHSQQYENAKKVFAEPVVAEESGADFDIREAIIYSEILKRPEY